MVLFNSLINKNIRQLSDSEIIQRKQTLFQLEEVHGFVFLGEYAWLDDMTGTTNRLSYQQWVSKVFEDELKLDFSYVNYGPYPGFPDMCWKAVMDKPGRYLPCFEELINPAFEPMSEVTHIELHVFGDQQEISQLHLSKAFDFLFDLEYMIDLLPKEEGQGGPVGIEGIDVMHPENPSEWELNVFSGYGAEFDFMFKGRKRTNLGTSG